MKSGYGYYFLLFAFLFLFSLGNNILIRSTFSRSSRPSVPLLACLRLDRFISSFFTYARAAGDREERTRDECDEREA